MSEQTYYYCPECGNEQIDRNNLACIECGHQVVETSK